MTARAGAESPPRGSTEVAPILATVLETPSGGLPDPTDGGSTTVIPYPAIPSRRQSAAMPSSPRSPSSTI